MHHNNSSLFARASQPEIICNAPAHLAKMQNHRFRWTKRSEYVPMKSLFLTSCQFILMKGFCHCLVPGIRVHVGKLVDRMGKTNAKAVSLVH